MAVIGHVAHVQLTQCKQTAVTFQKCQQTAVKCRLDMGHVPVIGHLSDENLIQ